MNDQEQIEQPADAAPESWQQYRPTPRPPRPSFWSFFGNRPGAERPAVARTGAAGWKTLGGIILIWATLALVWGSSTLGDRADQQHRTLCCIGFLILGSLFYIIGELRDLNRR
jgi:hypothetical protein